MKKNIFLGIFILLLGILDAQTPAFQWAKSIGTAPYEKNHGMALDAAGNIYTSGVFNGTSDFDPTSGTYNLTSNGNQLFISKIDAYGNFIWAKKIETSNVEHAITVDSAGYVYMTGSFNGTVDFDPGDAVFNLTANAFEDIFFLKLDPSGNFVWAKHIEGKHRELKLFIGTDKSGNIYTTGRFNEKVDFDPGPGKFEITPISTNDIYFLKLDALGNFIWAKNIGATSWDEATQSMVVDADGNLFTVGSFWNIINFNPGTGPVILTPNSWDFYILKLDSSGKFVWVKQFGGQYYEFGNAITLDLTGNIYISGSQIIDGPCDYCSRGTDILFAKLDLNGNFIWIKRIPSLTSRTGIIRINTNALTADANGNIYATGYFGGSVYFQTDISKRFDFKSAGLDIFILKLDTLGNLLWAKAMGGVSDDFGKSISLDASGNVYLSGEFGNKADLDPDSGVCNVTSTGSTGVFVYKYGFAPAPKINVNAKPIISIYPNPGKNIFSVSISNYTNCKRLEVYNNLGEIIYSQTEVNAVNRIDLTVQSNGLYFIRAFDNLNKITSAKIIKTD